MGSTKDRSGRITRRRMLAAGSGFVALAPAIIGRRAEAAGEVLYVNTYGGSFTEAQDIAYFKPFAEKTGIEVRKVTPVSFAKLRAQVQTGNYDWDVTAIDQIEGKQAMLENLAEPLDFTVLNKDNIYPGCIFEQGIKAVVLATCLTYRKDRFPNGGPKTWADFWDVKKFPQTRGMWDRSFTSLQFALLADGVPRDKLYPLDLDRGFKKLDELKPHIKVWWKEGSQSQQLMTDGEIEMSPMWNARAQELIDRGVPLVMDWTDAQSYPGLWFAARGTPRAKAAMKFLEFVGGAKAQADFCNRLPYGPTNLEAFKFMTPDATAKSPTAPDHLAVSFSPDMEWLAPNLAKLQERWANWIAT